MKRNFLLLLAVAALAITATQSCKKDKDEPVGVNNQLDPNNQVDYDFMAGKPGSWWRIGFRPINPEDTGTGERRATGQDSVVKDGFYYSYYERQVLGSPHITPEYFGKNDGYYTTLIDIDGSETNYLLYVFYEDSATTGAKWQNTTDFSYPGIVTDAPVLIKSEVTSSGGTESWNDSTFTNVVKVHSDISTTFFNLGNIGTMDVWFVRDLGVIKEEAHINVGGLLTRDYVDSLTSWSLVR